MYYVTGGIYTDMTFTRLEPGEKPVRVGPFRTYEEAHKAWRELAARTLDICASKYWIESDGESGRETGKAAGERAMAPTA